MTKDDGVIRQFETGATRDTAEGKLDYEGFLHPQVLRMFAEYMHKNRVQSDGSLRDSDNWQKGIPFEVCLKSLLRHVMEVWLWSREVDEKDPRDALCAIIFNAQCMLLTLGDP